MVPHLETVNAVETATLTDCNADKAFKCSGTIAAHTGDSKRQKLSLGCGPCTAGKGTTCFDCSESNCNINYHLPSDKIIKCPHVDNRTSTAMSGIEIYCSAIYHSGLKCIRKEFIFLKNRIFIGCNGDEPLSNHILDVDFLAFKCPQATGVETVESLLTQKAKFCIGKGVTKCYGRWNL